MPFGVRWRDTSVWRAIVRWAPCARREWGSSCWNVLVLQIIPRKCRGWPGREGRGVLITSDTSCPDRLHSSVRSCDDATRWSIIWCGLSNSFGVDACFNVGHGLPVSSPGPSSWWRVGEGDSLSSRSTSFRRHGSAGERRTWYVFLTGAFPVLLILFS